MRFLILCLSLISTIVLAKSPPPGTGAADVPVNVLLMLDVSASMSSPVSFGPAYDVAPDTQNQLFVAMHDNNNFVRYSGAAEVDLTVGQSGAGDAEFNGPSSIAVASNGDVFVADRSNSRVQHFRNDGTFIRSYDAPTGNNIESVALDSNYVYGLYHENLFKWPIGGGTRSQYTLKNGSGQAIQGRAIAIRGTALYVLEPTSWVIHQLDLSNITNGNFGYTRKSDSSSYYYYGTDLTVTSNGIYLSFSIPDRWSGRDNGGILRLSSGLSYLSGFYVYGDYFRGIGSDQTGYIYSSGYNGVRKFTSSLGDLQTYGVGSRLDLLKKVIKKLVTNSDLTSSANFGLLEWSSSARVLVNVSDQGASEIFTKVDSLSAGGGTQLDDAMDAAVSYLNGANSPVNSNLSCQKTILLVFSDGEWIDNRASSIAKQFADRGIETYVVGLDYGGSTANYITLAKAGGTYPDSPLFADDWLSLYQAMSSVVQKAIATNLSFTAPTIMPNTSGGTNHILQPSFTYQAEHQWRGHLKKYQLQNDGGIGTQVWDAGDRLMLQSPDARNIWTVTEWLGGSTSLNNFNLNNLTPLHNALFENFSVKPAVTETEALVKFIRGYDAFDEDLDGSTSDVRWMLGDIYHSQPILVGNPVGVTSTSTSDVNKESYFRANTGYDAFKSVSRREVIYVGANDGMLHAFDSSTGDEIWAFIPPMLLSSLHSMRSNVANTSHSIFGVDGSATVEDVYINGTWRTILMSGLGRGGNGYFALDVTNPEAPVFLFGIHHNADYSEIRYWGSDGNITVHDYISVPYNLDFSKLGEAWSKPQIALLEIDGRQKHVAIFGAGFNSGISPSLGNAVYAVDLTENGKILSRIDLTSSQANFANSVPADVALITPSTSSIANYKGAMAYVADLQGQLWKINFTNQGSLYDKTILFDAEASLEADRMSYFAPTASVSNLGDLWLYFGTGDQQRLQTVSGTIQNRVYGIKDRHFPEFLSGSAATASQLRNTTSASSSCPVGTDLGWFNNMNANEKVSGKLTISNEILYVSRYTPVQNNPCNPGSGLVSEHDYVCGQMFAGGDHDIGQGVPTQAVVFDGKVYIGVSGAQEETVLEQGWSKTGNVIVGSSIKGALGAGSAVIEGWREIY